MSGKSQVKVYLPEELHELLNADKRNNSEVVEAALWREFGGHRKAALERRIEEKEKRIETIENEIQERRNELQEEMTELEAYSSKLDDKEYEKEKQREIIREARDVLREDQMNPDNPAVQNFAEKAEMTVEEFLGALKDE